MKRDMNQLIRVRGGQAAGQGGQGESQELTYDAWLAQQPENVKALLERNERGLRNVLQAARQERDAFSRRLADVMKALGKDPAEAKRLLDEMSGELEAAPQRLVFYEEAAMPEIGCSNPPLAFLAAQEGEFIDKQGRVNWEALKQQNPELFQSRQAGTPGHVAGMDGLIRQQAGCGRVPFYYLISTPAEPT